MYAEQMHAAAYQQAAKMTLGTAVGVAETRSVEIPSQLQRLDHRLALLSEAISELDSRLSGTVARHHPPQPTGEGKQLKSAPQTSIGGVVDTLADSAEAMKDRVRDLLDRLEV